jgi:hypothetical protein
VSTLDLRYKIVIQLEHNISYEDIIREFGSDVKLNKFKNNFYNRPKKLKQTTNNQYFTTI